MNALTETNEKALNRHIAHTESAQDDLAVIKQWIDDHGEVAPDDVNWAHVGDMAHVANTLKDLADFIRSGR